MRTIKQLLTKFRACGPAVKKYGHSRAFKSAFINAPWEHGEWIGFMLFNNALANRYKALPAQQGWHYSDNVCQRAVGQLFRKKANRIKYWPEVRKRLIELGVKL
jgi:hypothetical protein